MEHEKIQGNLESAVLDWALRNKYLVRNRIWASKSDSEIFGDMNRKVLTPTGFVNYYAFFTVDEENPDNPNNATQENFEDHIINGGNPCEGIEVFHGSYIPNWSTYSVSEGFRKSNAVFHLDLCLNNKKFIKPSDFEDISFYVGNSSDPVYTALGALGLSKYHDNWILLQDNSMRYNGNKSDNPPTSNWGGERTSDNNWLPNNRRSIDTILNRISNMINNTTERREE